MIYDLRMLFPLEIGGGRVICSNPQTGLPARSPQMAFPGGNAQAGENRILLRLPPARVYADAQLDDTARFSRRDFRWKPPLRFSIRARTSPAAPLGTFGFGFWNDPFSLSTGMGGAARKLPAPPQCIWFFYGSPPLDLPLAPGVAGCGWKAATLRSRKIPLALLAPLAAGGMMLAALPFARRPTFGFARRFYQAEECVLNLDPSRWHTYAIEWRELSAGFLVDGAEILRSDHPPHGPLGLVMWIDNQYAVASAEKGFGFGVLPLDQEQSLELEDGRIESPIPA